MHSSTLAVFNLCNGVDVEATRVRMERYRRDHQTLIMKNRDKQVRMEQLPQEESDCSACSVAMSD